MTPFDLIGTERYRSSPFSVPCPHCGGVTAYQPDATRLCPSHASRVAVEFGGADHDALEGILFGQCQCTNRECQEYTHFVGTYVTEVDDEEQVPVMGQRYVILCFFPAVPLIRIPAAVPMNICALLKRAFAPAFMDQSAAGNLVRSSIEALLTQLKVARFVTSKGKRRRLTLHERLLRMPSALDEQKAKLLAVKWIGNVASHATLEPWDLRTAFEIVENVLEDLYGTRQRDLLRAVRQINKRRRP